MIIDPTNTDSTLHVRWTQTPVDFETSITEFVVDENTFHDGTVTIRQGEYFIYLDQAR